MLNALWISALVVGVLVAGMLFERRRVRALEAFAKRRGFVLHSPFVPGELPPMASLAERFAEKPATRWGAGLTGTAGEQDVTIAEHETPARGGDATGSANTVGTWHVLMAWQIHPESASGAQRGPLEHGGELAREGKWAAWRMRGNLTPDNVSFLLEHLPDARRQLES